MNNTSPAPALSPPIFSASSKVSYGHHFDKITPRGSPALPPDLQTRAERRPRPQWAAEPPSPPWEDRRGGPGAQVAAPRRGGGLSRPVVPWNPGSPDTAPPAREHATVPAAQALRRRPRLAERPCAARQSSAQSPPRRRAARPKRALCPRGTWSPGRRHAARHLRGPGGGAATAATGEPLLPLLLPRRELLPAVGQDGLAGAQLWAAPAGAHHPPRLSGESTAEPAQAVPDLPRPDAQLRAGGPTQQPSGEGAARPPRPPAGRVRGNIPGQRTGLRMAVAGAGQAGLCHGVPQL